MRYRFIFLLLFINLVCILKAQTIRVNNQASLNNAISSISAGDTILIETSNSPYTDLEVILNANGTAELPVVIMAESVDNVLLTGNSVVKIGGSYIYFEGFSFGGNKSPDDLIGDGVIEFRSSTSASDWCNNCKIKNIEFDAHNQSVTYEEEKLKWVRVYGQDNEIVNCTFNNKKGVGNCITVERNDAIENRTLIHHNYFANRIPIKNGSSVLNDQDAMRIGYSGTSLTDASCKVYNNFFYNWDGEAEIISNKSNRNKYYNNTFQKCVGTLTLRHGTHCEVYSNFFFGENISKSGGVRVIDSDHKIYNNYFQDLNTGGSKVVGAINLFKGDDDFVTNGDLTSYAICEDNLVANNTIVNCDKGIWIGPDDSGREYEPRNLEIANNIMIDCTEATLVGATPSGTNIIKGNIKKGGTWWSGFNTGENLETGNDLTSSEGKFERIIDHSEAIGYAVELSDFTIEKDIINGGRDSDPDAGAEEYNSEGTFTPYTLNDVGVNVGVIKSASTTGFINYNLPSKNSFEIYPNPAKSVIYLKGLENDISKINIYNANGSLLKSYSFDLNQCIKIDVSNLYSGVYLLRSFGWNKQIQSQTFIKK